MVEKKLFKLSANNFEELDYTLPFNQGYGGSFQLATRIAKHTPEDLNKIFYTICGSTAVESAIKIAMAYHAAKGDKKRFRFVGREQRLPRHEYWWFVSWWF